MLQTDGVRRSEAKTNGVRYGVIYLNCKETKHFCALAFKISPLCFGKARILFYTNQAFAKILLIIYDVI
jgi:hypothetical protein